ncbi:putative olfactory receptor 14L1 [Ornithorhynchus anatinus]|uniref:putative olfactory receptor 14L1 n=1 Tax=Ornithorhynchus anatinus TaxID=9258 RepID=UPI0010A861F2|nr:putative olfactory receptor 14L1 [Ornithorhynchus anatinus]
MAVIEFLILRFSEVWELQLVQATLFLLATRHLSILDLCYINVTTPKSILNSLTDSHSISFLGCAFQVFAFIRCSCALTPLLTAMSFDHFAAICHPLHYEVIMDDGAWVKMSAASWFFGTLSTMTHTVTTFSTLIWWSNDLPRFFCDIPQLIRLTGPDRNLQEFVARTSSAGLTFGYFLAIVVTYMCIFWAVLKMLTAEGQTKAFSTCLPYFAVVTLFIANSPFPTSSP